MTEANYSSQIVSSYLASLPNGDFRIFISEEHSFSVSVVDELPTFARINTETKSIEVSQRFKSLDLPIQYLVLYQLFFSLNHSPEEADVKAIEASALKFNKGFPLSYYVKGFIEIMGEERKDEYGKKRIENILSHFGNQITNP